MEVDQAAIDEILASAEADTPESRIDKLEKELDVLKGSVKKLLLDLRETLNNLENPFQNLQNLAEGALTVSSQPQPPQIQVIPAQIPEPQPEVREPEESDDSTSSESLAESGIDAVEDRGEGRIEEPEKFEEVMKKEEGDILQPKVEVHDIVDKEPLKVETRPDRVLTKYDIVTMFNLMEWVKGMLEKYTLESLRMMLELFEAAGYISEDAREFIMQIAELISLNDGFEDMLLELYRLHKLMNPQDTSMDSRLLSLILDKRL